MSEKECLVCECSIKVAVFLALAVGFAGYHYYRTHDVVESIGGGLLFSAAVVAASWARMGIRLWRERSIAQKLK